MATQSRSHRAPWGHGTYGPSTDRRSPSTASNRWSLDIRSNGTYAWRARDESGDDTESGDWTQTGTAVALNPRSGCQNTAVIEERDTLKIASDCVSGWELVFRR